MKLSHVVTALALALPCAMAAQSQESARTSAEDRSDVAITIYNNDLGLVRDTREVQLPQGEVRFEFIDVAAQIRPETVSIVSQNNPNALSVLEQNYEYDLISPQKLMEKYVGRTVRLHNMDPESRLEWVDAKLLSVEGGAVYSVDGQIYLGHPGQVVLPKIPENLIAKPTLAMLLDNSASNHTVEATYLTRGIGWRADYVLTLNAASDQMDVTGWVTLNNNSGATYENAKVQLIAGDVNQVPDRELRMPKAAVAFEAAAMRAMPEEEAFAEYHLYTLPRRTTIKENQSKQVQLLAGSNVVVGKRYEYRGNVSYYSQQMPRLENEKVDVIIAFDNEEDNGLGIPLPAGVMRIYQEDSSGALQFAGEDSIDHTPKDEEIRLLMGQAFDITAERVHTDFQRIGNRVVEAAFEITIKNHKEEDVVVDVVEPMQADWEIRSSSHDWTKKDAFTAVFPLDVEADGEVVLTYRVRITY